MANPILTADEFWLKVVKGSPGTMQDAISLKPFQFWASTDIKIYLGVFQDPDTPFQLDDVSSVSLEIKELVGSGAPAGDADAVMSKTVTAANFASDDIVSRAVWEARDTTVASTYHLAIEFTDTETTIDAGSYWMVISAVMDNGKILTLAAGTIAVLEDGTGPVLTADTIAGSLTAIVAAQTYLKPSDTYVFIPFSQPGTLAVNQVFGYLPAYAMRDMDLVAVVCEVDNLSGANLTLSLRDETDTEVLSFTAITDGDDDGIYELPTADGLQEGGADARRLKITQVGTTTAGEFLRGYYVLQAKIQQA